MPALSWKMRDRDSTVIIVTSCGCISKRPEYWTMIHRCSKDEIGRITFIEFVDSYFKLIFLFQDIEYKMFILYCSITANYSRVTEIIDTDPTPPVCIAAASLSVPSPLPPVYRPRHAISADGDRRLLNHLWYSFTDSTDFLRYPIVAKQNKKLSTVYEIRRFSSVFTRDLR
jgi:hypothetical protein